MKRRKRLPELWPAKTAKSAPGPVRRAPLRRDKDQGPAAAREGRSGGEPLDAGTRREMESLLGEDLGEVRIHRDSDAAEAVGARACARGQDVYFRRGSYQPDSLPGRETLAHELTHVVQTGGRRRPGPAKFEPPSSDLEREARRAAAAVRAGRRPEIRLRSATADVLRQEKEEKAAPTVSMHSFQITPAHRRGTIHAGAFSIAFRYEVAEGTGEGTLILAVPDGVEASFAGLGEEAAGLRIDDPGGSRARTVKISAAPEVAGIPRVRARFSQGPATHVVTFQLPVSG